MIILRHLVVICLLFPGIAFATTVKEVKTKNGLTAWLVEEHSQPIISVSIAFRKSGTAILSDGAGDMDSQVFTRALEENAIRLSFSADEDSFYSSMETLSENRQKAFSYLGLALQHSRFDDDSYARIKKQTIATIRQQQEKPLYRLSRAWQERIFSTHPYSKPELGTLETIENLTKNDLKDFTKNYLTRANIIISVVGDITADELSSLLTKNFSELPESYNPDVTLTEIKLPQDGKQIAINQDIPQTIINFGLEGLKRDDPDYITGYVTNYLLGGGGLTSILNNEIREKRGLAYSAYSSLVPMQYAAVFTGKVATRNEKAEETIAVLKQTLKDFAEKGITEAELSDAKRFLIGSFAVNMDSNSSIVNFLTSMQLHNLGIDYMDKRNNLINSVSVKQVNEMAKRLVKLDKLQIVMIGNPKLNETGKP
jgi:zinc protease